MSKSLQKVRWINYPDYSYNQEEGMATLLEPMVYLNTGINHLSAIEHATLTGDGHLFIQPGLKWDFGTGPAIDTPGMIYGSLAHDVLYYMIDQDQLPSSYRKAADKYFIKCLKDAGVPWWRRSYIYAAVRYGRPVLDAFKFW